MDYVVKYLAGFSAGIIPACVFFVLVGGFRAVSDISEEIAS